MQKSTNRLRFFVTLLQAQQLPQARRQAVLRRSAETGRQHKYTEKDRRAQPQRSPGLSRLRQQLRRKRACCGAAGDAKRCAQPKRAAGDGQQPPQAQRKVQQMRRGERKI